MRDAVILMIEDNPDILRTNREALEMEGYRLLEAMTLEMGRDLAESEHPDLILLDIMLPDGNGLAYCRELLGREGPRILFLSALDTKEEVIAGLRAGGDDYMTKPYLMEELLARVEVLLRPARARRELFVIGIGGLTVSRVPRAAYLNGRDLLLTPKELTLLELLLGQPGQFLPSGELYRAVWGMQAVDTRPVKQHIRNIRIKLGADAPVVIESQRGRGYRLLEKTKRIYPRSCAAQPAAKPK